MAITTYAELQTVIADYLDDETLNARIPDFIRLFEVKASRLLRNADVVQTSIATTDANGQVILPADFRSHRRVTVGGRPLDFLVPEDVTNRNRVSRSGTTYGYTIEGKTLTVVPPSIIEVEMVYLQTMSPLAVAGTNWLFEKHPDCYLYGALTEAEAYAFNDPRMSTWKSLSLDALTQVALSEDGSEWGNAAVQPVDRVA